MLEGLLNGFGAQRTRPLEPIARMVSKALAAAYIDVYFDDKADATTRMYVELAFTMIERIKPTGGVIFYSMSNFNKTIDEVADREMPKLVEDKEGISGLVTISILAEERLRRQGLKEGGFDAMGDGVGYFVEGADITEAEEPLSVQDRAIMRAKTASAIAEREAAQKAAAYVSRYERGGYEIDLVDPRAERKTLHGLRRR